MSSMVLYKTGGLITNSSMVYTSQCQASKMLCHKRRTQNQHSIVHATFSSCHKSIVLPKCVTSPSILARRYEWAVPDIPSLVIVVNLLHVRLVLLVR